MKRFLAICLTLTLLLGVLPLGAASADTTMQVTGGWLRLRSAPSFSATTLASYFTGTVVTVLGTSNDGNWYKVSTQDGLTGYMYCKYLTSSSSGSSTSDTATVVSSNGLGVRLRTGPSVAYGILQVVPVGTTVKILARGSYWCFVRVGTQTGYMMSQFLSDGSVTPTPSSSYQARVTSSNGLGVRLRNGAGTNYSVLGVYSVGTEVTVLKHGTTWDYIRIGSRTGYMMTKFLTTSSSVITKVTLNNTSPRVGDTLYAVVYPGAAVASVTYRWTYSNGTLVGTGSSYVPTSADIGKKLRVTVTGSGLYTGSAASSLTSAVTYAGSNLLGVTLNNYAPSVGQTLYASVTPAAATASYVWYRSDGTAVGAGQSYTAKSSDVGKTLYCVAVGTGSYSGTAYSTNTSAVTSTVSNVLSGSLSISGFTTAGSTVTVIANLNTTAVDYSWYLDGWKMSSGASSVQVPNNVGSKLKVRATAKSGSGYTGYVESGEMTITGSSAKQQLSGEIVLPSTASVGSVVYAAPSLSSASVSYSWTLNGSTIVGATGSTITVSESMAGGVLTVTATANGTDGYTGSVTSNSCAVASLPVTESYTGIASLPSTAVAGEVLYVTLTNNNSANLTYDWYADGSNVQSGNGDYMILTDYYAGRTITVRVTSTDSTVVGSTTSNGCSVQARTVTQDETSSTTDIQ